MCSIGISECVQSLHLTAVFVSILVLNTELENFVLCSCVGVRNEVAIEKKKERKEAGIVSNLICDNLLYKN